MIGVGWLLVLVVGAGEATTQTIESLFGELLDITGFRLLLAIAIVALGVWISKLFVRVLGRTIAQRFVRQSVAQTIIGGIRGGTIGLSVLLAGSILGLGLGDILLNLAVFSAVVGIILAPIVGNVINGIFVLADQPYEIGDMIELDNGTRGFVDDITIRYTKMLTLDNTFLVVPNGNIRERDVTNFSAEDERTRISLDVLVTYESDLKTARSLAERAARDIDPVIKGGPDVRIGSARYPAGPACLIHSHADNGVLLRLRYWIKQPYKIGSIQSNVRTRISELYADAPVEMAYPHQHLVFDDTSGKARVSVEASQANHLETSPDTDTTTES